jgi:hypothetical protein
MSTTTSAIASPATASPTSTGTSNSNGPSSPLLFFVALGFGVVFTNLWIIVGVKYCFRYNQRNRQRMNGEDPDGVDLTAMPQRRRRREKKLMTMDEVNEKFPLTKYKAWRATRADEGLPTAGGINTTSRPPSIHNESLESKDLNTTSSDVQNSRQTGTSVLEPEKTGQTEHGTPEIFGGQLPEGQSETPQRPKSTHSTITPDTPVHKVTTKDEDEEEDDHIQTAVPAAQLPEAGDSCAICIDNLDDDDDIRGLQCGHAFHASCVDPWLTSRRACCPLCKTDYYVPKPRPEGPEGLSRSGTHAELPPPPPTAFSILGNGRGRRPAMIIPGRFMSIVYHDRDRHGFPIVVNTNRPGPNERQRQRNDNAATTLDGAGNDAQQPSSTWRSRLAGVRMLGRRRAEGQSQQNGTEVSETRTTPSQLEAGRS